MAKAAAIERRGDRWALHVPVFGWTLFADTEDGLYERFRLAMTMYLDAYPHNAEGIKTLMAFLERNSAAKG